MKQTPETVQTVTITDTLSARVVMPYERLNDEMKDMRLEYEELRSDIRQRQLDTLEEIARMERTVEARCTQMERNTAQIRLAAWGAAIGIVIGQMIVNLLF